MTFQFRCPQGHLLEGDPQQAGLQCQCPTCGMLFIIPAAEPVAASELTAEPAPSPTAAPQGDPMRPAFPDVAGASSAFDPYGTTAGPKMLHIPCPNGHELETPPDMLNQDVMCPHCGVQFQLREKNSVEFKRKKREQEELREARLGKSWFRRAIIVGVLVVLGLLAMIVARVLS